MMRINRNLMVTNAGSDSRTLLRRWGQLHAVRTALGFAALGMFLRASIGT